MKTFEPGKKAYIVISNREVSEVTIVRNNGNFYIIRFPSGGGLQVRANRLYATHLEATQSLPCKKEKEAGERRWHSHYEYGL